MADNYSDMTNAELATIIEELEIEEVKAKNPGKPNKKELIAAIQLAKGETEEAEDAAEEVVPEEKPKTVLPTGDELIALRKRDALRKIRVVIVDRQENQTKGEVISITWGNRFFGIRTDLISTESEPQYVTRGALQNLRDMTTVIQTPKSTGGVKKQVIPRFVITEVEGLTADELAELATKQRMRNAKV